MPGIDFDLLRSRITLAQVLDLVGFRSVVRSGDQLRGPCPVHLSNSPQSKSFPANLSTNRYRCFKCGSAGGQLELWAAMQGISVYQAALDLCDRLGVETPWIQRW